jgi:hypothetical protein
MQGKIREFVLPESMIFTDELKLYEGIGREYRGRKRIKHKQRIYVEGDAGTQNLASSRPILREPAPARHPAPRLRSGPSSITIP